MSVTVRSFTRWHKGARLLTAATAAVVVALTSGLLVAPAAQASALGGSMVRAAALAPPAAPASVTATPLSSFSVRVNWVAPANGGSPITGYTVQTLAGGSPVKTTTAAATAVTSTVTGLSPSTAYTFVVTAINADGVGADSLAATADTIAATPQTTVTASRTFFPTTGSATVTVTGSGFLPNAPETNGTRPPLPGLYAGAYVAFGRYADVWKPSAGAASTARVNGDNKWGVNSAQLPTVDPGNTGAAFALNPDGTFNIQLTIDRTAVSAATTGNYGIYTYAGSGAAVPGYENFIPITFADAPAAPASVTATPLSSYSARVNWTAPANGGSAITGYTVQTLIGGVPFKTTAAAANAVTTVVSGLSPSTEYTFVVTATNGAGTGPASSPAATAGTIAATPQTTISASRTVLPGSGPTVVTITGSGFLPNAPETNGTRPPLPGLYAGAYVAFGRYADVWKPSAGAASTARVNGDNKWGVNSAQLPTVDPGNTGAAFALNPDGTFNIQLTIDRTAVSAATTGNYGIYTYAGSGAAVPGYENFIPITFADLPAAPVVTAAAQSSFSAKLTWPAPADGGSAITGYTVQTFSGGNLVKTTTAGATAVETVVTGLNPNTTYTFVVAATNGIGTGPESTPTPATTIAATPQASIQLSRTVFPTTGTATVTVTGTGFLPNAPETSGTRPPLKDLFGGSYVAFGRYADVWKPSAGAAGSARSNGDVKWGVQAAQWETIDPTHNGSGFVINADGSFSVTLSVDPSVPPATTGNYGIYTYAGSGAVVAGFENFVPITFSDEPTTTEPTTTQPTTPTDPTSTDPTSTDPTVTEPTSTEPTSTEPTSTEPTVTDPTATDPTDTSGPSTSENPSASLTTGPTDPAGPDTSTPATGTTSGGPASASVSSAEILPGGSTTVIGSGFAAGEDLEIWLHSEPVLVASLTADTEGSFTAVVTVPADTPAGAHTLVITGRSSGTERSVPITVLAAATGTTAASTETGGDLATTGVSGAPAMITTGLLLLLAGGVATALARRRPHLRQH